MNESSSKFVDQFATEKLLNEKLSKVHHSPLNSFFIEDLTPFDGLEKVSFDAASVTLVHDEAAYKIIRLASPLKTLSYPENNDIYLHYHPAAVARGNILLVHGLFDDNMINYNFLIQLLNEAGFNLYLFVLPYHYERKPAGSLFSGEFFWSADLFRSHHAAKQAVFDLKASISFIQQRSALPTILSGFSMGGNVSLRYFLLENTIEGLFLINPVTRLSQLFWESPLLRFVQNDLESAGYDLKRVETLFRSVDPVQNVEDSPSEKPIALGYSIYDQIVSEAMYLKFIDQFGFHTVIPYNAGHLNILRVPKLASDIAQFFRSIVNQGILV